ncbi:primosomal protein N' [Peptostreptococcus equinus]|uniref:Replication restart protein PriA n=1 Tax=Peptostreptococcus equinus TaxID=3003601 RepID=A0ABY7JP30_9FIRM|nr:primosomal protein N' [Peptostreptococcus sp. CBA3647]WAW14236.1 primosomal protein N' [Peptostreptococcus sp. CBA3647]
MYLQVILRNKGRYSDMLFTYSLPQHLENELRIGHRVSLPFGKSNKPIEGFVVSISKYINSKDKIEADKVKDIFDILDKEPMFSKNQIRLIFWMRNRYMCTYNDVISLFYPKGYKNESIKVLELKNYTTVDLSEKESKLLKEIRSEKQLYYNYCLSNYGYSLIKKLLDKNLIAAKWIYKEKINQIKLLNVSLSIPYEELLKYIEEEKLRLGKKQEKLIYLLSLNESILLNDLRDIFEVGSSTVKSMVKKGIVKIDEVQAYRSVKQNYFHPDKQIELNSNQKHIFEEITKSYKDENIENKPFLLHGVTGSGKTEIYLELIKYMLDIGLDSLFLVPEIALTPQMISRVRSRFGSIVGIYHSQLSEGQKHDMYKQVKDGNIRIVIGTRSSIFLPYNSLGLIIIDEEHDMSYKSEMTPKYDTLEVARYKSIKENICLVMGSATPSISDYLKATQGIYNLLKLDNRANNMSMPNIEIVDMRKEVEIGNKSDLSKKLTSEIRETLKKGEQVILYLNRRGYANFVSCKNCGHVFKCKNCDISLTYHKYKNKGVCHYCGHEEEIPNICPVCGSNKISSIGFGTQKIEEEIKKMFPDYKVLRIDKDTTSKKGQLEKILSDFNEGKAQILIGTQILSKGHDFDNVTLVGIVSADMMLNYPDYRSFEHSFQQITQVAGRAGRADKKGKVILQTYDTDHFVINKAASYDYKAFYESEIKLREAFAYEPFNNILRIVFSGKNYNQVKEDSYKFYKTFKYLIESSSKYSQPLILGPNECSINKIKDKYRWQVVIKDTQVDIKDLKAMVKYICIEKYEEIFNKSVSISLELNPNTFI